VAVYADPEIGQAISSYKQAANSIYEIGRKMQQIGNQSEGSIENTVASLRSK
jgi:hypothetical protein